MGELGTRTPRAYVWRHRHGANHTAVEVRYPCLEEALWWDYAPNSKPKWVATLEAEATRVADGINTRPQSRARRDLDETLARSGQTAEPFSWADSVGAACVDRLPIGAAGFISVGDLAWAHDESGRRQLVINGRPHAPRVAVHPAWMDWGFHTMVGCAYVERLSRDTYAVTVPPQIRLYALSPATPGIAAYPVVATFRADARVAEQEASWRIPVDPAVVNREGPRLPRADPGSLSIAPPGGYHPADDGPWGLEEGMNHLRFLEELRTPDRQEPRTPPGGAGSAGRTRRAAERQAPAPRPETEFGG